MMSEPPRCRPVPVLALKGADSPRGLHRGHSPGHWSPPGARSTGGGWSLPASWPDPNSLRQVNPDHDKTYRVWPLTLRAWRAARAGTVAPPSRALEVNDVGGAGERLGRYGLSICRADNHGEHLLIGLAIDGLVLEVVWTLVALLRDLRVVRRTDFCMRPFGAANIGLWS